jgi:tight adherence protein B
MAPTLLAAVGAALAVPATSTVVEATAKAIEPRLRSAARRMLRSLDSALRPLRLAGEHGVLPSDRERLRLQGLGGLAGLLAGSVLAGLEAALVCGAASAWLAGRALFWRRERYRRRVDAGAGQAALAIADALAGGQAVRGALAAAADGTGGAVGRELRVLAAELEMGARTADALGSLRTRCRSRRIDLIVAAIRVQRRSGGALANLLREVATAIDDQDRLHDKARAAIAQARFTSSIVALLPPFGVLLGELASPGFAGRIAGSPAALWLAGVALALQVVGLVGIARLARVDL